MLYAPHEPGISSLAQHRNNVGALSIETTSIEYPRNQLLPSVEEEGKYALRAEVVNQSDDGQCIGVGGNGHVKLSIEEAVAGALRDIGIDPEGNDEVGGVRELFTNEEADTSILEKEEHERTGLEIQASGEVEDEGFVVVQNIDMDDEIMYHHPCMVNVTGIGK
ncbi:hypothetical protein ACFX13_024211 [Malus domestica]